MQRALYLLPWAVMNTTANFDSSVTFEDESTNICLEPVGYVDTCIKHILLTSDLNVSIYLCTITR